MRHYPTLSHILFVISGPCFLLGLMEVALSLIALVSLPAGDPELDHD